MKKNKTIRLDKFLSNNGYDSRRNIRILLKNEEVTINGIRAGEPGLRVDLDKDDVKINGQKTKLIVHCIDATEENSLKSYETIRNEFGNFSKELLNKPEIIFLTKKDLISEKELAKKIKELKKTKRIIIPISIYDTERLEEGKKEILKNVI